MSDNTAVADTNTVETPSLGLQDIENALKIIDFACEQGAFKGWTTINQVRSVRNKISAFVEYANANSDQTSEAATPAAE